MLLKSNEIMSIVNDAVRSVAYFALVLAADTLLKTYTLQWKVYAVNFSTFATSLAQPVAMCTVNTSSPGEN